VLIYGDLSSSYSLLRLNDYIAPVHQVVDDSDDSGIELVD
jgi:hypothetical protein